MSCVIDAGEHNCAMKSNAGNVTNRRTNASDQAKEQKSMSSDGKFHSEENENEIRRAQHCDDS